MKFVFIRVGILAKKKKKIHYGLTTKLYVTVEQKKKIKRTKTYNVRSQLIVPYICL